MPLERMPVSIEYDAKALMDEIIKHQGDNFENITAQDSWGLRLAAMIRDLAKDLNK